MAVVIFGTHRFCRFETFYIEQLITKEQPVGDYNRPYSREDRHFSFLSLNETIADGQEMNSAAIEFIMNSSAIASFEKPVSHKQLTIVTKFKLTSKKPKLFNLDQHVLQTASIDSEKANPGDLTSVAWPIIKTSTAKEVKIGDTGKHRCVRGLDTLNRSAYWRFNDEVFPGLHDAFAKWDTLNMIFLVRDWRKRKDFTRRNKDWSCHFADCGSQSEGRFVLDSKGSASTQIVRCDVPGPCLARWKAADPKDRKSVV